MKVLVLGGTGATGKRVIHELISRGLNVITVVRSTDRLTEDIRNSTLVEVISGTIHDYTQDEMNNLIEGCAFAISCLGHNITFKGLFGRPQHLVRDVIDKVTKSIESVNPECKIILMSTTGKIDIRIGERREGIERVIFPLLYLLLPPHRDNMLAADLLIKKIGYSNTIEWLAVRPDTLIVENVVTEYELYEQLQRSSLTDPGRTSRINVGHFMAELVTDKELWNRWKYKMPVIYNS